MTIQICLNENMRKLWWGTLMEKLPRSPMWGQWKPYIGGDMTLTCLFCGVGRCWWRPSWLSMATGALYLDQESSTDNGQSASCPFSFVGGWGRLCRALWCLSGFYRSLQWCHPGSWIPLIQLFLHPRPFVLMENDRWPPCFLRGWNSCCEAGGQVQASVWLSMSFPSCQDGGR